MRQFLRQNVPAARRRLDDATSGDHFATNRDTGQAFPHPLPDYALPISDYAGQAHVAAAKRQNLRLLAEMLDATVVQPGEIWSLWRLAGRPTYTRGYRDAAAIVDGELTTAVGGSTCLLSTVVFNAGLHAGLDIVDTYGDRRYFELGRDATIEYGYLDLRFRNPHPYPLRLHVTATNDDVRAAFEAPVPPAFTVDIAVEVARPSSDLLVAATRRLIHDERGQTHLWTTQSHYRTTRAPSFRGRIGLPNAVTAGATDALWHPLAPSGALWHAGRLTAQSE